ncbi:MAG TPA: phosphatase PAP2 family protein [Polyangiaceae bacterium]|nr:phosphatase PAP2 family protein [Polyangiaceae bacterium]
MGLLFGTATAAALAYVALSRAVARGKTERLDRGAKRAVHRARGNGRGNGLVVAARSATPLGKWWGHLPPTLLTAGRLLKEGRRAAAVTIAGTSVTAAVLPLLLDRISARRLPPPERGEPKQSYPSGHALQSSALALTTTYVMRRERLASPAWLASLGPLSLAAGLSRLLLDRHWASDVLGGYCAGIALGAGTSGLYELSRSARA